MRWIVSIVVLSLLLSMAIGEFKSSVDPLGKWKGSITEWPESLGEKTKYTIEQPE
jgi:hypothetical protein